MDNEVVNNDMVNEDGKEKEDGSNSENNSTETSIEKVDGNDVKIVWDYDLKKVVKDLCSDDEDIRVFNNSSLISELKNFCIRNNYQSVEVPKNLFAYNANGYDASNLVRMYYRDELRYSAKYDSFYKWSGKQYVRFEDDENLTRPISEFLTIVEHSAFQWIMTSVKEKLKQMKGRDKDKEKDEIEKSALSVLKKAQGFTSNRLARDVREQYKGMWMTDDFEGYYDSPYINMQNGVLDLVTMELHPHLTEYKQYKISGCDYDPAADCPEFRKMLNRMLPEDTATQRELQKAFGLCLSKERLPAHKVLNCLLGVKDSGKTTLVNAVLRTLGEYGTSVDSSLLMQTKLDKTRGPEMSQFMETLLVSASESNEADKLDTSKVKSLTGNTTISFRFNNSNRIIKYSAICVIFLDSNYRPYIPPRESATWDRLRYFGFDNPIKEKKVAFDKVLDEERAGIFNWLLEGLDMVKKDGEIFETPSMLEHKEQFRKDVDIIDQFISECLVKTDNEWDRIATSQVFSTYQAWAKDNNYMEIVKPKFHEAVREHLQRKTSNGEVYLNIKYSELGFLYSRKNEHTPMEFAKAKRLLQEQPVIVPYKTLRSSYFKKTWGWFIGNIKPHGSAYDIQSIQGLFIRYIEWCSENGLVGLKWEDFKVKVTELRNLTYIENGVPKIQLDAVAFEQVKDIWGY